MIGFVAADGEVQVDKHAAEVLALKLVFGAGHLRLCVVQHCSLVVAERDEAGVNLAADVEEHIDEGNLIVCDIAGELAVVFLVGGVGCIDNLGELVVEPGQLCKLAGGELVGEHVAVHGLNVGQAHGGVDFVVGGELFQDGALFVEVPGGDNEGDHIGGGEAFFDHVFGDLGVIELRCGDEAVAVGVGAI